MVAGVAPPICGLRMCAMAVLRQSNAGDEPEHPAVRSPGLRLALALEIDRHGSADKVLQRRLIDLLPFVDVDGAPDIPLEAGVEQTCGVRQRGALGKR